MADSFDKAVELPVQPKSRSQASRDDASGEGFLLERAFSALEEAVFIIDAARWRIIECNEMVRRLFGYEKEEVIGRNMGFSYMSELAYQKFREQLLPALDEAGVFHCEVEMKRKDGSAFPAEQVITEIRDDSGRRGQVVGVVRDITERKRAEDALRESERKYRSLYTAMDEAVALHEMVYDGEGNPIDFIILDVNPAYEMNVGIHGEDIVGRRISERFSPPPFLDIYAKVVSTGEPVHFESYFAPLQKHFSISAIAFGPAKFATVFRDITERKQSEETICRQLAEITSYYDNAPIGLAVLDVNLRFLRINNRLAEINGIPAAAHIGKTVEEVLPTLTAQARHVTDEILRSGRPVENIEFTGETPAQPGVQRVWLEGWYPLFGEQGEIIGFTVMVRDITVHKRADEELRRQKELLQTIMDNIPVMIAFIDEGGRTRWVNREWQRVLGWSEEEATSRDIVSEMYPDPYVRRQVLEFAMKGSGVWRDFRTRVKTGRTIDTSWANIWLSDGTCIGLGLDTTQLKQAEYSLHQLSARLLRLQDEERRHLARELHDTTAQKLAILLLNLKRLDAQTPILSPTAKATLGDCHALAGQCADELRTLSYLLHPPLLDELGLPGAVRDYADGFARRSGLRVDLEVSPSLDRLPREMELSLFRVLQESLTNVHRHSGSRTVSIRLIEMNGEVWLEIEDTGRGLRPNADPASGQVSPNKLGVGIVGMRERLRELGGRLELESTGRGTMVKAILPWKQP